jgi:LysM domain.
MREDNGLDIPSWVNNNNKAPVQGELKTDYGTVRNINTEKLRAAKKKKIKKIKNTLTLSFISAIIVASLVWGNSALKGNTEPHTLSIPTGYTTIHVTEQVMRGENVTLIAQEYFSDEYKEAYGTIENFVNAIIKENELNRRGDITPYQNLTIPALVAEDNIYLQQIEDIKNAIEEIKENNYWVSYTVKPGDSFSKLAARASGDSGETVSLTNQIMSKNGKNSSYLVDGQTILTINPELGPLKLQLNELQTELYESLKIDQPENTR